MADTGVVCHTWKTRYVHLSQMYVTKIAEHVGHPVALSVMAYLFLVRLYERDDALSKNWSLFDLKERFMGDVAQEALVRTERKWQRKLKQSKDVA